MPEISVIMGTYNENKTQAAQAITSVLNQTFQNFEFIICDDGSEKEFFLWLKKYCSKDHRILLLRNQKNRGLAATLNRCLWHATGTYIARMDADDRSRPDRLEQQIAFLRSNRAYALTGSNAQLVNEHGVWGMRRMEEIPKKQSFLNTSPFIHPSVMMRKEAADRVNGYRESLKVLRSEDYDFFMRLYAEGYRGYNIQEPLLAYREDAQSYARRKYCYRINECRVRYQGFGRLGIRRRNWHYVFKPLVAGLIPAKLMYGIRKMKYGKPRSKFIYDGKAGGRSGGL